MVVKNYIRGGSDHPIFFEREICLHFYFAKLRPAMGGQDALYQFKDEQEQRLTGVKAFKEGDW